MSKNCRLLRWLMALLIGIGIITPAVVKASVMPSIEGRTIMPYRDESDRLIKGQIFAYWLAPEGTLSDQFYLFVGFQGDPMIITSEQAIPIEYVSFRKVSLHQATDDQVLHTLANNKPLRLDPSVAFDHNPFDTSIARQLAQLKQRLSSGATFGNSETLWLANMVVLKAQRLLGHDLVPKSLIDAMLDDFTWINGQLDVSETPNPLPLRHLVDEIEKILQASVDESPARAELTQALAFALRLLTAASATQVELNLAKEQLTDAKTHYELDQEKVPNVGEVADEDDKTEKPDGETIDVIEGPETGGSTQSSGEEEDVSTPEEPEGEASQRPEELKNPQVDDLLGAGPDLEKESGNPDQLSEKIVIVGTETSVMPAISRTSDGQDGMVLSDQVALSGLVEAPNRQPAQGGGRQSQSLAPKEKEAIDEGIVMPESIVPDDLPDDFGETGVNSGIAGAIVRKKNTKPNSNATLLKLSAELSTIVVIAGTSAWFFYRRYKMK